MLPISPLFRKAAVEQRHPKWLGDVTLIRPISFWYATFAAAGFGILVAIFFAFAQYTKRSTVSGQLLPDTGLIKVFSPQPGIVLKKAVREGELVSKGKILYVLSSERQNIGANGVQATVSEQVTIRQQSLRDEIIHTKKVQKDEESALQKKIGGLAAELSNVEHQIVSQRKRLELAEHGLNRAEQLLAKGYVSAEMAQQKHADFLDQQNRLDTLERDKIACNRELQAQLSEMVSLPLRQRNGIGQLERIMATIEQELTESEGKRIFSIVAPEDGIATAAVTDVGQSVDGARPLVTIIPSRATLQAYIYAPSRSIGFIRVGDQIYLRYQAYPYQKFGHGRGKVMSISKVAMLNNETMGGIQAQGNGEPVYLVTALIDRQTINIYGKPQPLQAGMLFEADVLQERRRLYEWVLEPLFSLTGKL